MRLGTFLFLVLVGSTGLLLWAAFAPVDSVRLETATAPSPTRTWDGPPAVPEAARPTAHEFASTPPRTRAQAFPSAPLGMVVVPAGTAVIGTTVARLGLWLRALPPPEADSFVFETPERRPAMPSYCIDRYEVTNAQYRRFLEDVSGEDGFECRIPEGWSADLRPPPERLDHPVRGMSYLEAARFAHWAGKHIPTEVEWEYAARGPEGHAYPWGEDWYDDTSRVWWCEIREEGCDRDPVPVDDVLRPASLPRDEGWHYQGASWCGAWHLSGNVAEWTSSWFEAYPGNPEDHDWLGPYVKVIRGGSALDVEPLVLRPAARNLQGMDLRSPPVPSAGFTHVGFRCAWSGVPGQARFAALFEAVQRSSILSAEFLAGDRWVAAEALDWVPSEDEADHHVYVRGPARTILVIPLRWAATFAHVYHDGSRVPKRDDHAPPHRLVALLRLDVPTLLESEEGLDVICKSGTYVLVRDPRRFYLMSRRGKIQGYIAHEPQADPDAAGGDVEAAAPRTAIRLEPALSRIRIDLALPPRQDLKPHADAFVVRGLYLRTVPFALEDAGEWRYGRAP